ncbi:MAG: phosphotransferase [Myxococcales bacterium]|nr:phosphotransferase [Myxococcales bacterium]
MRYAEIAEREDVDAVVAATLSRGLSVWLDTTVNVQAHGERGQQWWLQPLLSAYFVDGVSAAARRFLADQFRYTPRSSRALAQWLLGTALATGGGLRVSSRRAFTVAPGVPDAADLLLIPGNQRLRLLDFARGRSRVLLKEGFSPASCLTELEVRVDGHGPFPPILDHDPAGHWLEEPLLSGFTLPRCPPWRDRARDERRAITALDEYLATSAAPAEAGDYVAALRAEIAALAAGAARLPGAPTVAQVAALATALAARVEGSGELEVARGHGDFQAGNVFVEPGPDRVWLIDWESSGVRQRSYDALVYGLGSRAAAGLGARAARFVAEGGLGPAARLLRDTATPLARGRMTAFFLLEELVWALRQAHAGRYRAAPAGLAQLPGELAAFLRLSRSR